MRDLIVYGLGELGQLFGGAALRAGLRVTPITRGSEPAHVLAGIPTEVPILIAVGEAALDGVLSSIPDERKHAVVLLQNGLFPAQWQRHGLVPTLMIPWLLKKKAQPLLVARPTPVFGQHAALMDELHRALGLETEPLANEAQLAQAIVDKYAFILSVNALGVARDVSLSAWLEDDSERVRAMADEAALLGALLCGHPIVRLRSVAVVEASMRALGSMSARGRTSRERVERALAHAARLALPMPQLSLLARTEHA